MGCNRRFKFKQWRNGSVGTMTAWIEWYSSSEDGEQDIRLIAHDTMASRDIKGISPSQAEAIFTRFQFLAPSVHAPGAKGVPVVEMLIDSLRKNPVT